ncbi:DUF2591 family protein, partial [Xenorhabdus sp. XENO-7]
SELTGRALDWAVARAIGFQYGEYKITVKDEMPIYRKKTSVWNYYCPSTDWAQCGELIDTYLIELNNHVTSENEVEHWATCMDEYIYGSTALEAACRIVVHVKLGDEIDIPDELEGV